MKKALVTGGSGAIGAAICLRLAEQGCHVLVHANSRLEQARTVVDEVIGRGGSAEVLVFDVTRTEMAASVLERAGESEPIQIIVNNAGIHEDAPMVGMMPDAWFKVIDVSLNGFFNTTHPLLMPMIRSRWGRIVNMSSIAGVMGNRGQTNYAAAKSGLHLSLIHI